MDVITRFAPSPTGFLHIGGARTALFNFLFARHHGGRYLLRVEDTDRARSTKTAIDAIHQGLGWLDLAGDGEATYQSTRQQRHTEIAEKLLAQGHAYRCYLTPEELKKMRDEARKIGQPLRSPWRDKAPRQKTPDAPYAVRLKMPLDGTTTIADAVQGTVSINHQQLDDLVMLRSDGTPTYMLAVVVDDYDMGVSHIIRGDDHLNNAFRQQKIIEALGWAQPIYAHIPLIHGSDGAKLSKRHGALGVMEYEAMGFLPEAVNNYLLRLGWAHGDDEIISRTQAIKWFDLGGIGKSPARFDMEKLTALNKHYLSTMKYEEAKSIFSQYISKFAQEERLKLLMPAIKERAKTTNELREMADFIFFFKPLDFDEEIKTLLDSSYKQKLTLFADDLPADMGDSEAVKTWFVDWLIDRDWKMRDFAPGLRAALTGKKQTLDIILILTVLGSDEVKARIRAICNNRA